MQLRSVNMEWILCTVLDNIRLPNPATALRGELCRVIHQWVPSLGGRALVSDQCMTTGVNTGALSVRASSCERPVHGLGYRLRTITSLALQGFVTMYPAVCP